jgi:signal transduction histidine kinase
MSPAPPALVLVADDNAVSRLLLSESVRRLGHRTITAANGRQALDLLRDQPVDLALLDIEMPELDGRQVLERMKADPAWRPIPVIMVSAIDELAEVVRCIAGGAEDYLPKPFEPTLLAARIGASLEKKRLRDAERRRTAELEKALAELRAAQSRLLVQEKLASLGALTAGIAHEIKNPLNFVTNFAELSQELFAELRAGLERAGPLAADVEETLTALEQNTAKVREHARRADGIVAGMLLHARGGKGHWQTVDLNALVDQAVALAYHGLRARDPSLQVALEKDYDPAAGHVLALPQDLSRVFLNLAANGCYAAREKKRKAGPDFTPTLTLRTRGLGDRVEVRVRDNGDGVPAAVRERLFQPFFTTKPAGEGTGLGLSISYDIVVRVHRGELRLETEEGAYAELIVVLPRDRGDNEGMRDEG